MKQLALALALTGSCVLATTIAATPASALETYQAQMEASDAASQASLDMLEAFGFKHLKPGQYLWRDVPESAGAERVSNFGFVQGSTRTNWLATVGAVVRP